MNKEVLDWYERGKMRFSQLYSGPLDLSKAITGNWERMEEKLPGTILDATNDYKPEFVNYLKAAHINTFHVVFSVGFNIEAEKIQRDLLRPLVEKCHQCGIKLIAYLDSVNIFWVSLFESHPEAKNWLQVDKDGNPVQYGEPKGNPWRYRACLNNPNWIEYRKKIVKMAIDMGFSGIYLDNPYINMSACYCSYCRDKFKKYCREKLAKEHDLPTQPNWSDSVWQAFIKFRYETLSSGLIQYRKYIKSVNPQIAFTFNTSPPTTLIPVTERTMHGVNVCTVAKIADFLYFEIDGTFPRVEDGRLISNIESLKYGISATKGKNIVCKMYLPEKFFPTATQVKLAVAEVSSLSCAYNVHNLTFMENQSLLKVAKTREALGQYFGFLEKNENCYVGTRSIADVAVLYSQPTQDWYCNDREEHDYPHCRGLDQALIDSHFLFDIIHDEDLTENILSKYKTLILPNVVCMSQDQIEQIEKFVEKGHGLVATAETSLYNENYRKRNDFGLARILGMHYGEKIFKPIKSKYGQGRVVFFPGSPGKDYWLKRDPRDLELIREAIDWVVEGSISLLIEAPKTVSINLWEQNERIIVHLVNYDRDEKTDKMRVVDNIKMQVSISTGVKDIFLISPDFEARKNLQYEVISRGENKCVEFTIPKVEIYSLVIIG